MKIRTITLNPSLDQLCSADIRLFELNILRDVIQQPAGKGINVSRILKKLQTGSVMLGFLGGIIGKAIEDQLESQGYSTDFVPIQGNTRTNLKIYQDSRCTELNQKGPSILPAEFSRLLDKMDQARPGDLLVISGSVPGGLETDCLEVMVRKGREKGCAIILDSSGPCFEKALAAGPDYIKPNDHELAELLGTVLPHPDDPDYVSTLVGYGRDLLEKYPVKVILLSMGAHGSCWIEREHAFYCPPFRLEKAYPTGAGDSMVSGLAYMLAKEDVLKEAIPAQNILQFCCALASACCMNPDDVLFRNNDLEEILQTMKLPVPVK